MQSHQVMSKCYLLRTMFVYYKNVGFPIFVCCLNIATQCVPYDNGCTNSISRNIDVSEAFLLNSVVITQFPKSIEHTHTYGIVFVH